MNKSQTHFSTLNLINTYITHLCYSKRNKAPLGLNLRPGHNSSDSLTVSLRPLKLGDLCESNVFGRRKYAEFSELSLKIHEIKIQPEFEPRTQIR